MANVSGGASLGAVRAQIRRIIRVAINEIEARSILISSNLLVIAVLLQSHPRFQTLEYAIESNSWYLASLFNSGVLSQQEVVEKLADWAYSEDTWFRSLAAAHPHIDPVLRHVLSSDPDPEVREVFARRPDLTVDEHIHLALDHCATVASAAILDAPVLPTTVRDSIVDSSYWLHPYLLAQRSDLPADLFHEIFSGLSLPLRSGLVRIISQTSLVESI